MERKALKQYFYYAARYGGLFLVFIILDSEWNEKLLCLFHYLFYALSFGKLLYQKSSLMVL